MLSVDCIQSPMSDDSYDLAPTPRRVLTDDVVDSIRDAILSGKIRPGARLIEEDLARDRSRSAAVRSGRRSSACSRKAWSSTSRIAAPPSDQVSEDDVAEIYSLRLALERLAIEQASRKAGASGARRDRGGAASASARRRAPR